MRGFRVTFGGSFMLLSTCNQFLALNRSMSPCTGCLVPAVALGKKCPKNKQRYAYCKENEELVSGLSLKYIMLFRNYYLMSHCYFIIRLSVVHSYFCSVLTYMAIFQRSSTLICEP